MGGGGGGSTTGVTHGSTLAGRHRRVVGVAAGTQQSQATAQDGVETRRSLRLYSAQEDENVSENLLKNGLGVIDRES